MLGSIYDFLAKLRGEAGASLKFFFCKCQPGDGRVFSIKVSLDATGKELAEHIHKYRCRKRALLSDLPPEKYLTLVGSNGLPILIPEDRRIADFFLNNGDSFNTKENPVYFRTFRKFVWVKVRSSDETRSSLAQAFEVEIAKDGKVGSMIVEIKTIQNRTGDSFANGNGVQTVFYSRNGNAATISEYVVNLCSENTAQEPIYFDEQGPPVQKEVAFACAVVDVYMKEHP